MGSYVICERRKPRSACACVQSDLDILCSSTYTTISIDFVRGQQMRWSRPALSANFACVVHHVYLFGPFCALCIMYIYLEIDLFRDIIHLVLFCAVHHVYLFSSFCALCIIYIYLVFFVRCASCIFIWSFLCVVHHVYLFGSFCALCIMYIYLVFFCALCIMYIYLVFFVRCASCIFIWSFLRVVHHVYLFGLFCALCIMYIYLVFFVRCASCIFIWSFLCVVHHVYLFSSFCALCIIYI